MTMHLRFVLIGFQLIVCGLALQLASCTSSPATHFYVLEAISPASTDKPIKLKQQLIGVGPITLPPLLERKQIVTRNVDNSVAVAEFHQWAAPLKDNVLAVLTENLARLQPEDFIRAYPWSAYGNVNYRVLVDITRFDASPGLAVNFDAGWAIMDESTHRIIDHGHYKISRALLETNYPASVQALNLALGQFSQAISRALQKL